MKSQRAWRHTTLTISILESRSLWWQRKPPCHHHQAHRTRHNRSHPTRCRHHQAHRSRHSRSQPRRRHRLPIKVNASGVLQFKVYYLERSFVQSVVLKELNAPIVIDQCQNAFLHIHKNCVMHATRRMLNKRQSVEWELRKSENNFNPLQWWRWDVTYGSVWSWMGNMVRASNLPAAKDS